MIYELYAHATSEILLICVKWQRAHPALKTGQGNFNKRLLKIPSLTKSAKRTLTHYFRTQRKNKAASELITAQWQAVQTGSSKNKT